MKTGETDLALRLEEWVRFRDGDRTVYAQVAAYYAPLLGRFLARYCADPAQAEDVLQESLIRLYERRIEFDPSRSFRNWLFTIALNCSRDHERVRRGRLKILRNLFARRRSVSEVAPSHHVREIVQALAPEYRQVLVLYYYEGFSYDEIADLLQIPLGTVKSRMSVALERLRPALKEHSHAV